MQLKANILLVDDEPILTGLTREYLEAKGFSVTMKHMADDGFQAFKNGKFDLCILDVKMPFKSGFELAEEIRGTDQNVPILFLSGEKEQESRIKGLMLGAEDYVTKPFSMQELFLRIQVILRRSGNRKRDEISVFSIGRYKYDKLSRTLTFEDEKTRLSEMEGQLLVLFCTEENGRVTRDHALREIWQDEDHIKSRSLNVYINKLRKRLSLDPNIEILNVHGTGYQLIVQGG